jgi:hypothetical protein
MFRIISELGLYNSEDSILHITAVKSSNLIFFSMVYHWFLYRREQNVMNTNAVAIHAYGI